MALALSLQVMVNMTSPVTFYNNISTLSEKYWTINQARYDTPSDWFNQGGGDLNRYSNASYWPVNATQVGDNGHSITNSTIHFITLYIGGTNFLNPFYGQGLFVNWTATDKVVNENRFYLFYHKKVDLALAPLSQICTKDCYL